MTMTPFDQGAHAVRFEWGARGLSEVVGARGIGIVVDVLSFSTSVTVAAQRGILVYPVARDGPAASALAERVGAAVATRRVDLSPARPWSLSPASLRSAPHVARLVLPSPNGAALCEGAEVPVAVGSLRNAAAVAAWAAQRLADGSVTHVGVIAAGERWPDGSLRPCLEDLLGAGSIASRLAGAGVECSPEARAAADAYAATPSIRDALAGCASGLELSAAGFARDVEIAAELDVTDVVPLLGPGGCLDASSALSQAWRARSAAPRD